MSLTQALARYFLRTPLHESGSEACNIRIDEQKKVIRGLLHETAALEERFRADRVFHEDNEKQLLAQLKDSGKLKRDAELLINRYAPLLRSLQAEMEAKDEKILLLEARMGHMVELVGKMKEWQGEVLKELTPGEKGVWQRLKGKFASMADKAVAGVNSGEAEDVTQEDVQVADGLAEMAGLADVGWMKRGLRAAAERREESQSPGETIFPTPQRGMGYGQIEQEVYGLYVPRFESPAEERRAGNALSPRVWRAENHGTPPTATPARRGAISAASGSCGRLAFTPQEATEIRVTMVNGEITFTQPPNLPPIRIFLGSSVFSNAMAEESGEEVTESEADLFADYGASVAAQMVHPEDAFDGGTVDQDVVMAEGGEGDDGALEQGSEGGDEAQEERS